MQSTSSTTLGQTRRTRRDRPNTATSCGGSNYRLRYRCVDQEKVESLAGQKGERQTRSSKSRSGKVVLARSRREEDKGQTHCEWRSRESTGTAGKCKLYALHYIGSQHCVPRRGRQAIGFFPIEQSRQEPPKNHADFGKSPAWSMGMKKLVLCGGR